MTDQHYNKVARIIDEYDLGGIGEELETRWTGDGVERMSLRDLADYFNRRLLEEALLDAEMSAFENDTTSIYHKLSSEDVSAGIRTDTKRQLTQNGINVDKLESDFVSYQAIRSYLTEVRDAEYNNIDDGEKIRKDLKSIQQLLSRTLSVAEERIDNLVKTDRIEGDKFEVLIEMQILCRSCGEQYSVSEFLKQRGCKCQLNDNSAVGSYEGQRD
jgi:hypothetical protein